MNAMMAGSGPTAFAICENSEKAVILAEKMKEKYEKVYVTRTL